MKKRPVVYGAGGHGKVVAEILAAMGHRVDAFIDDDARLCGNTILGMPVAPAAQWLESHSGSEIALGIGNNRAREEAVRHVKKHGCMLITAIHPAATVSISANIAEGVVVMAAAVLNADCYIEEGAIVNSGAIIEHEARVGRYAHISPNAALGGGAQVGALSHIGISASILPLRKVGSQCIIGAGAVVIDDIPDGRVAYGVPARVKPK